MVAVCNNLSFGKVDERSDIDLFIVARSGRLFIVRSLVTAALHVLGVRRHGKAVAGRFCLSFFVDDSRLDLSDLALEKDIYLAFWIKSLLPILDDGLASEFFEANLWAKGYFEREEYFKSDYSRKIDSRSGVKKFLEKVLVGRFGNKIENFLMSWQLERAKKKAEKVETESSFVIDRNILKFHNFDRRKLYRARWIESFGENSKLTKEKFTTLSPFP